MVIVLMLWLAIFIFLLFFFFLFCTYKESANIWNYPGGVRIRNKEKQYNLIKGIDCIPSFLPTAMGSKSPKFDDLQGKDEVRACYWVSTKSIVAKQFHHPKRGKKFLKTSKLSFSFRKWSLFRDPDKQLV